MDSLLKKNCDQFSCEADTEGGQRWLTTFNDMITLLLVFFVLLFSMGSMDLNRFKHFQNALQNYQQALKYSPGCPVKPKW